MKQIYGKYRLERITQPYYQSDWNSLNGWYTMWFFLNNQFGDYYDAGLTAIIDNPIPEDRYIWITTWPKGSYPKLSRLFIAEYDESQDLEKYKESITTKWYRFSVELFTNIDECIMWIKDNTDLVEVEAGKFLIADATEVMWETIPAQYLVIN